MTSNDSSVYQSIGEMSQSFALKLLSIYGKKNKLVFFSCLGSLGQDDHDIT